MSKSIFDIDRELYSLYDEIEEAGGEITPEMEKKLEINGQEMINKVKNITNFINNLNADILAIKSETDRLAKLKKSKENTIKGLTNLVLFAIKKYGKEDNSGKKWIDWGTGKVTIRKSETVEVNSKKLEAINDMLKVTFANGIYTGTLNQNSSVDEQALLDAIVNTAKDSGNYECSEIEIEDLDDVNIEVTVPVKLTDLLKGDGYQLMTNIGAVNRDGWKFKPSVDKKLMKVKIKDDGCVSNIAEVVQNMDAFNFFNNAIGEGKAIWDKAACLNMGEKVYVSAKLPVQTSVSKDDVIDNYLVFSNGHDGGSSVDIMITPVRVICTNMLNGALDKASCHIRLRHTKSIKEKLELGAQVLKVACSHALDAQELYRHLTTIKMSDEEVYKYLCELQLTPAEIERINQYDPNKGYARLVARDYRLLEAVEISSRKANQLYNMMDYYNDGIGQKDICGTAWGAYNAVTGFYCNVANLEGEKRMNSLVWGSANNNMNKALNAVVAYAS